jgi:hypothetical protein
VMSYAGGSQTSVPITVKSKISLWAKPSSCNSARYQSGRGLTRRSPRVC